MAARSSRASLNNQVDIGDVERGGRPPSVPAMVPDPTGEKDIFLATGVMPFEATTEDIFDYVESKAISRGTHVKRNRGTPPGAREENMLSVQEKAIIILGRAIGVTWGEIKKRIIDERLSRGEVPPDRHSGSYHGAVIAPHMDIVRAIHADMLDALEVFSPLVGGSSRIIWRAKMIEYYRQNILRLARSREGATKDREARIAQMDRAMIRHFAFFDSVMREEDISKVLGTPADRSKEQELDRAEAEVEEMYNRGEISDIERVHAIRRIRHGED